MLKNIAYQSCLILEDDPEDQELLLDVISQIAPGVGCYAVSNGEEALSFLLLGDLIPDIIITDLNMPLIDGLTFLQTINRIPSFAGIPAIVFSDNADESQRKMLKQCGAIAIYLKQRPAIIKQILLRHFVVQPASGVPLL